MCGIIEQMRNLILLLALLLASPLTAAAQAETAADFADEGLSDTDLTTDLEAESLPTTDPVAFWWEQIQSNVISVFTMNAERKAEQYRLRLHILDRKLAACSEIGDEECVTRIEERMAALEERTGNYIAKREELQEQFQERFAAWRERRESAREHRQAVTKESRETRRRSRQDRQDLRQEQRGERQQLRQENPSFAPSGASAGKQEKIIELRSQNVKNRLDATQETVERRQAETTEEAR